ncbi:MAG: DUF554 domain-containing protein [Deferribacteraceae bacterium]|jgi:uncharacterized membrane protein YqgA involved in biofilm formation|nr:DUF554 domain-containing protein [Deferribacteraceae bacterium]
MIIGTVVNAAAIVAGGVIGLTIARLSRGREQSDSKILESVFKAMGLSVAVLGIKMALKPHDFLSVVVCLSVGTLIGELLNIEGRVEQFGRWLKSLTGSSSGTFVDGFVATSILFCVGATAILGSFEDGLKNDPTLLYTKSIFDGISAIIFSSTMGAGVLFSAIPILIYQGILSFGASQLSFLMANDIYMNGISVAGGILVIAIGLNIMGVTKLRVGNMLPALLLIPIWDAVVIYFL